MTNPRTQYHCIGKGFCGSVWAFEDNHDGLAIKREDGGPGRSLTNDFNIHVQVLQSTRKKSVTTPLAIPNCYALIQPDDNWWLSHLSQFPTGYTACRALISERIPKVPRAISNKIVDLFCADDAKLSNFVKFNADDDSCLIRPYLGRRRRQQERASTSRFRRFTLRNVPLHVDQMEALGLHANSYAEAMADALALMHWGAQIDANDVEFVLAPPRQNGTSPSDNSHFQSDYLGPHSMWILDFDCCRSLSMDEAGIEQACAAFFRNDPYYPRPGSGEPADEELWAVFRKRFLKTSREIVGKMPNGIDTLVERFVTCIEEEGRLRQKRKKDLLMAESA